MLIRCLFVPLAMAQAVAALPQSTPSPRSVAVAGFERFHRARPSDDVAGGLLLLGELGCANCHSTSHQALLDTKRAPRLGRLPQSFDADWIRRFLDDPGATKPGTTMPNTLKQNDDERAAAVDELVHYIASLAKPHARTVPDAAAIRRGGELFHRVGCVACHEPQRNQGTASSVLHALVDLERKWSHASLQRFLQRPLEIRPSGRMPEFPLHGRDSHDLAHYLLRATRVDGPLRVKAYLGGFQHVDDIEGKLPDRTGIAQRIGLEAQPRRNSYALVFDGFLDVPETGEYTFHLHADDRARLLIEGKPVLDIPRAHKQWFRKKVSLRKGKLPIRVQYVQHGATAYLDLEWEGPGIARQPLPSARLTSTLDPVAQPAPFVPDAAKVARGRARFAASACVRCHEESAETPAATALEKLEGSGVCSAVSYALDRRQRTAIAAALDALRRGVGASEPADRLHRSLVRHNCYACHDRGSVGGVLEGCVAHFLGEDEEENAEACIPPTLTGVGDKLRKPWLTRVLEQGTAVRPSLPVRMPRFGRGNVRGLADAFVALDRKPTPFPEVADEPSVLKRAGRQLVGNGGFGCIKCHVFHEHDAPQMQSPDLVLSTERVHADWFARFLRNPESLKPGTRMPTFWTDSGSSVKDVLDGDMDRQIVAMWSYLSDGRKAVHPEGLTRKKLELVVGGRTVLYRGKIRDVGNRGICVGFPDQLNLAFDAEHLRLALLWKGRFLNVAAHWRIQGMGKIRPLGHSVVKLPPGQAFATLDSMASPWPETKWRAPGLRFLGYDLDARREPTLRYSYRDVRIEDEPRVARVGQSFVLRRTIRIASDAPVRRVFFRAARGREVVARRDQYAIDRRLDVRVDGARVRELAGWRELLVPVRVENGKGTIRVDYSWSSKR